MSLLLKNVTDPSSSSALFPYPPPSNIASLALENLDIKDINQIDKLKNQAESFDKKLKTKYKDYLDDQE